MKVAKNTTKRKEKMTTKKENGEMTIIEDGIESGKSTHTGLIDIGIDAYHSGDGISRSGILEFMRSPYHYYKKYVEKSIERSESSKSLSIGSLVHGLLLEPDKFNSQFAVMPTADGRTKDGRAIKEKFAIENASKMIVNENDYHIAKQMASSLDEQQKALLNGLQCEQSLFWSDPHTGILLKARPDGFCKHYAIDIKTAANAAPGVFKRTIIDHGYHIQAAMIDDALKTVCGIEIKQYVFVIIENTAPFACATYILEKNAIEKGRESYKNVLLKLRECIISNTWPSYETQVIDLPAWAY